MICAAILTRDLLRWSRRLTRALTRLTTGSATWSSASSASSANWIRSSSPPYPGPRLIRHYSYRALELVVILEFDHVPLVNLLAFVPEDDLGVSGQKVALA